MNHEEIEVGLDIGTTKICAIAGKRNEFGKLEVIGMGKAHSYGVNRGMVTNIDKTVDSIKKAIKECEENSGTHGIEIGNVHVGIAGQHIKSSKHHGSIMRPDPNKEITVDDIKRLNDDMNKIVIPPGSEIIHVMPQDYTIDYHEGVKEPVGMLGGRLEADFHIITAQTMAVNNINKCVKRAGQELGKKEFDIKNLILEPLASSMATLTNEEMEAGIALIDIGGGTTDIAIFHENIIRHTAVIPFGGDIVTTDIKQGCSVMQQQAELLKTRFGAALAEETNPNEIISIPGLKGRPAKEISIQNLAHIIQARMEEIVELAYAEIANSGYKDRLAGGIVITGGGAQLKHLQPLVELMTGMDARVGHPNEYLGKCKDDSVKSPMYATSVGLVLAGFKALDHRDEYYEEQDRTRGKVKSEKEESKSNLTGTRLLNGLLQKTKDALLKDFDDDQY